MNKVKPSCIHTRRQKMDFSFKSLKKLFERKSLEDISSDEVNSNIRSDEAEASNGNVEDPEVFWTSTHFSIVLNYLHQVSQTCDDGASLHEIYRKVELICSPLLMSATEAAPFGRDIRPLFMVPSRLDKFHQIQKYHLVEAFLSFLLQLLYYKKDLVFNYISGDPIDSIEKELRFLLTIFGDLSWMLCDEGGELQELFQKLVDEFEAMANEAGRLVHSLLFSFDRETGEFVLNHFLLLIAFIVKFLDHLSSFSIAPKTSVVNSFFLVKSLIYDLEDVLNRDDNPITDVREEIERLHQGLTFWQSSIKDIGSHSSTSEIGELKEAVMRIGDMAHVAEYLIISFLVGDAPLWYLVCRINDINLKITLIATNILEIIKKHKYFSAKSLHFQDKRNWEVNNVIVGFEDEMLHILDQLVGGTDHLQVISIFGMPGLGKTTLAKKLYNHPSVNCRFDKLSWCSVSQTYQMRTAMVDILIHIKNELGKDEILKMGEGSLVEHIYKTLKGRRYLIVMDDVWDSNVWDDLRRCLPDDGNGSRILLTSRYKNVAPPDSNFFPKPSLSNDQCWELLQKKVIDNQPCPPELLGIGKKIAANCGGVPLAVVVIAGILSTMDKEASTWKEVEENLASYIFGEGDDMVVQILELSYKHLPQYLKPCFLSFGGFSEYKEFSTGNMTRLWIAEGFIHKEVEKSAEEVAEEYLMELIDKSLIMVTKRRSDGGVKTCVMHDLLRELCQKKSNEENFQKYLEHNIYSKYEKGHRLIALHGYKSWSNCQYVRSWYCAPICYLRDLRLLRVLYCVFPLHGITGMEYLVYLRYLVISDLTPRIDRLVNLEYLRVQTRKKVYMPSTIMEMKKLRYICVNSLVFCSENRDNSQTNNLESLSTVVMSSLTDEEMLKCSPHLRKLKCYYKNLSPEEDNDACPRFDLGFLSQLDCLNLRFSNYYSFDRMEKIGFPSNIRKLTLCDLKLPCWEMMSTIGRLGNLEVLKLRSVSFEHERWDTRDGEFEMLRYLELSSVKLSQWNVDSSQHFPVLQRLIVKNCRYLQEISCEIGEIATLEMIVVQEECLESLRESAQRIRQEQLDMGNEELKVIQLLDPNFL